MPDLSADAFQRVPDPTRLLAAVLKGTGFPYVDVDPSDLHEAATSEEIHLEEIAGGPSLRYRVSLRRRETYSDRLYRLLVERWPILEPDDDDDELDTRDALDDVLRSLGADPHRVAP